jgi:starch phosphorylase
MMRRHGSTTVELEKTDEMLDPEALTIGFARRFATYKRGAMLFSDIERLKKILCNKERPVQFIFAGKAHPKDTGGKELIKQIVHLIRDPELANKIIFIENYDINVARYLVQGVDVWLNNPRRPLEASGTSGMKVPVNGGINCSIPDGWWCESYDGENGWSIGNGEEYEDEAYQDEIESKSLYDLLEKDIIPTFYDRSRDRLPRNWIQTMRRSMMTVCPIFNTYRMVAEYAEKFYLPSSEVYQKVTKSNFKGAHELYQFYLKLAKNWRAISVVDVNDNLPAEGTEAGQDFTVTARVQLGKLDVGDVTVEVYQGYLDSRNRIINGHPITMKFEGTDNNGLSVFTASISSGVIGHNGYAVRILPQHELKFMRYQPGMITWE